jgi:hypothetical protein
MEVTIKDPKLISYLNNYEDKNKVVSDLLLFALDIKEALQYKMDLNNIEKTVENIMNKEITKTNIINNEILESLNDLRGKSKVSISKGKITENIISSNIQTNFPTCELIDTTQSSHESDLRMYNGNKPSILIEVKNYKTNIPKMQVDKFKRDLDNLEDIKCGIFISTSSGIAHKKRMTYEYYNNKLIVYIPNGGFDGVAITWGILFIYAMHKDNGKCVDINMDKINMIKEDIINISNLEKLITKMRVEFNNQITTIQSQLSNNIKKINIL